MKILIVTYFFPPMNAIGGQRPYAWAKTWAAEGHQVDVITITKDRPFDEVRGFRVHEVPPLRLFVWLQGFYRRHLKTSGNPVPAQATTRATARGWFERLKALGIGTSTRMPDASDLWILPALAKARSLGEKWDCVVSTFGPYSTHVVAQRLKQSGHAGVWLADFRDLWTLNPYFAGLPIVRRIEVALERYLMRSADGIITVSAPLAEQMRHQHPGVPTHVIENGADVEEISSLKPQKKSSQQFQILYAGTIYSGRRDPTPLLRALVKLAPTNVQVLFAGPSSAEVTAIIRANGAETYTRVLGMIPRAEALQLQQEAHVLLFLESNAPDAAGVLTGKLFEYLFSGTEVWGVGVDHTTLSGQIIASSGVGEVFGPDEAALFDALKRLSEAGPRKVELRADYRQKFDRREQAKKVLQIMQAARR